MWPGTRCWGSRAFRSTTPFATCSSALARDSASVFSRACGVGRSRGYRNVRAASVRVWTRRCSSATGGRKARCAGRIRASMGGPRIIRCWRCWPKREAERITTWRALDAHYAAGEFHLQLFGWDRPRRFVVIREQLRAERASLGRKLLDVPGYTFRLFVTNLSTPPEEIWRDYNRRAAM